MTLRRARSDAERRAAAEAQADTEVTIQPVVTPDVPSRRPRSPEEAEQRYVTARDAWTSAMRAASSGRPADLATLAVAQEAYEAAAAERQRWLDGRVAIPIEPEPSTRNMDAIVGQELAWRRVRQHEPEPKGLLGRVARRIRGR